jgi:hypothetical protein
MSLTEVIPAGLSAGVASTSVLVAKLVVGPEQLLALQLLGVLGAGRGVDIGRIALLDLRGQLADPRNSNSTFQPGCCCW